MDAALIGQRVASPNEVTHGEILLQIGELKGQVATLITLVGQKREDINAAFTRLGAIEQAAASHAEVEALRGKVELEVKGLGDKVGKVENIASRWGGFALACSLIFPIIVTAAQPYLHFGGKPASAATHVEAPR